MGTGPRERTVVARRNDVPAAAPATPEAEKMTGEPVRPGLVAAERVGSGRGRRGSRCRPRVIPDAFVVADGVATQPLRRRLRT